MPKILITILSILLLASCGSKKKDNTRTVDFEGSDVELPDTLRVGMLNSPTTYFDYRGTPMGYDYELMESFAKYYGLQFSIKVGASISEMTTWIENGVIDILASPVPSTAEFKERVLLCGPKMVSSQVLVQKAEPDSVITDVTQLVGREVMVQRDSKYFYRIQNLNDELGGGIKITTLPCDTVSDDDLLSMVWKGEIPLTVVDSDVAEAAISYYPGLDITLKISLEQHSQWAVNLKSEGLGKALNRWFADDDKDVAEIYKKYYSLSKSDYLDQMIQDVDNILKLTFAKGRISPYDNIFRNAGKTYNIDWRLIAAVAYVESHFTADVNSWSGALGLMQVMPRTATSMGYSPSEMSNPAKNVDVGVKTLVQLDKMLSKKVSNPEQRMNLVLASYNAGPGHILDAIALADKYGLDSQVWEGNVEEAVLMKTKPAYYNDPVVKNGYFRGRETVAFVRKVRNAYNLFKSKA